MAATRIYLTTNEGIDIEESYADITQKLRRESRELWFEVTRPGGQKLTIMRDQVVYIEPSGRS